MPFDRDDDIRREEADVLHGHAGGWYTHDESELQVAARAPKIPNTDNEGETE